MTARKLQEAAEKGLAQFTARCHEALLASYQAAGRSPVPTSAGGNVFLYEPCGECGSRTLRRAGSCAVCTNCGSSAGCS